MKRMSMANTNFTTNFDTMTDHAPLSLFLFQKADVLRKVSAMSWPSDRSHTKRNRYRSDPLIVTCCVILRFMCTSTRWQNIEDLLGRHCLQLSEIFWEGVQELLSNRFHLLTGDICASFIPENMGRYALAIHDASSALNNCIGFTDSTVIGISQLDNYHDQNVANNGQKRKNALKYQAVTTLNFLIILNRDL